MAYLSYSHSSVKGIVSVVPPYKESVQDYIYFNTQEAEKFSSSTGIYNRHLVKDSGLTSSDLCLRAAEKLIYNLQWEKETIDGLIFVSQTRDYILPSTSCILQNKLGLKEDCYTIDIPYGCSGYLYGLQVADSLVETGQLKRILLLVGDVITPHHNIQDKSSHPLFGDAGTATAIEYTQDVSETYFHFATDGSGYNSIIIPDGGYRNRVSKSSFELRDYGDEGCRTNLDCSLNGMDVFSFGITKAPLSVKKLMEKHNLTPGMVDYFVMHQANRFLNEKIRKKLKINEEKTPYSLSEYGNTSCASIPITICSQISKEVSTNKLSLLMNAFGVGLSWGSAWITLDKIFCEKPIVYEL